MTSQLELAAGNGRWDEFCILVPKISECMLAIMLNFKEVDEQAHDRVRAAIDKAIHEVGEEQEAEKLKNMTDESYRGSVVTKPHGG